jgi:hypothetical protein
MSQEPEPSADLSGLEMDLLRSLQPSWVKESPQPQKFAHHGDVHAHAGSGNFEARERKFPKLKPVGRKPNLEGFKKERPQGASRFGGPQAGPREGGGRRFGAGQREPREPREPRPQHLEGWEVLFIAEERGVEGLVKQIKSNAKAYALFDLARLVLEKSARYRVAFKRTAGPPLFRVVADSTLWLSESEALAHAVAVCTETHYRRERVAVEPPKGDFPAVAQCGMSGVFLGPPNHHDYQLKLRKLHAERFSNVPFEVFKSRVRTVRDEESLAKWREEQSFQDVFHPAEAPEGDGAEPLRSLAEVAEHFRKNHAAAAVDNPGDEFETPGSPVVNDSAPPVVGFVRAELDKLIRFPLPLAHSLGRQLGAGGLQIFKANENITYISAARPKPINRETTAVSAGAAAILDYLEANASTPRAKQWQDLLALPRPDSAEDAAQRESVVLRDLYWLLQQGHVIDFATKNLQAARRPAPKKPQPPKVAETVPPAAEPAPEVPVEAEPVGEVLPETPVEPEAAPEAEAQAPSDS